jgi:hypothetical protein
MNDLQKLGFDNWFQDKVGSSPKGLGGLPGKANGESV